MIAFIETISIVKYLENFHLFCEIYPVFNKTIDSCNDVLKIILNEYAAPSSMITDGCRNQLSKGFKFYATLQTNWGTKIVMLPHQPNENPIETCIR